MNKLTEFGIDWGKMVNSCNDRVVIQSKARQQGSTEMLIDRIAKIQVDRMEKEMMLAVNPVYKMGSNANEITVKAITPEELYGKSPGITAHDSIELTLNRGGYE